MKFSAVLCFSILFACGCNLNNLQTRLINEQKLLKDSANNTRERINDFYSRGIDDKADEEKAKLEAVQTRLIHIQSSLDSLEKVKK